MPDDNLFTLGGVVQSGEGIYVERSIDDVLLSHCQSGEYIHVLSPSQMGKSSLIFNVANKLESEGIRTVYVELTSVGIEKDPDKWFLGFLYEICSTLTPDFDLFSWWKENAGLSIVHRFSLFIKDVLLQAYDKRIVIFVDEIDVMLDIPFANEFFAVIRSLFNRRANYKDLIRISIVLVGRSTIQELTKGAIRWFNFVKTIQVENFKIDEAIPLVKGFCKSDEKSSEVLSWVFEWTNGHPYLTQVVCANLFAIPSSKINKEVTFQIIKDVFLGSIDTIDKNVMYIHTELKEVFSNNLNLLEKYYKILCGEVIRDDDNLVKLKSVGLIINIGGELQISNNIYAAIFNKNWLLAHFSHFMHELIDPNKTVFISYRRAEGRYAARSVYEYLKSQGYDVFLDVESIDSGEFGSIILNQIASRVHFLVILNPGSLDRCNIQGDWLRKEIEFALDLKRNIVPLMFDGFSFSDNEQSLSGNLSALASYNGIQITHQVFKQTMEVLVSRFLQPDFPIDVTPPPEDDLPIVLEKMVMAEGLLVQ